MEINNKEYAKSKTIRVLLILIGSISTLLGIFGIFLPLLPTTPFLLLSAYCFARSSKKFYILLITNRICGEYIRNYRKGLGIQLRHKVLSLILLWTTIGYSVIFIITNIWIQILLILVAISVSIHLLRMKTYIKEDTYASFKEKQKKLNKYSLKVRNKISR